MPCPSRGSQRGSSTRSTGHMVRPKKRKSTLGKGGLSLSHVFNFTLLYLFDFSKGGVDVNEQRLTFQFFETFLNYLTFGLYRKYHNFFFLFE